MSVQAGSRRRRRRGTLWLAAAICSLGCEVAPEGDLCAAAASKIDLWTNGACLRGANVYQRRVYPEIDGTGLGAGAVGPPYGAEDFEGLAATGANVVDVSHPGIFSETAPYDIDEAVLENLYAAVDGAAAAGLFSVISYRTGPGRNEFVFLDEEDPEWVGESLDDETLWQSAEAQDAWAAMWRATAERFRDHRAVVAYDLMVEPNSNALVGAYSPEEFYPAYDGSLLDWNRLYPLLAAAIREVDTETPILVGALGWSHVGWLGHLWPIDDPRVVYAVHQYDPRAFTSQAPGDCLAYPGWFDADGDGAEEDVDEDWLLEALAPVDSYRQLTGAPLAVNELGVARWAPGAAQFLSDEIDLLERLDTGWAIWLWYPSFEPWAEYDEFSVLNGPDPASHAPLQDNELLRTVEAAFERNAIFPDTAPW
ncbi:MAG: glycoside hydrolase family 5 protein [Proteobacteria bacterium]|nr:glycoside hydrolase family 5 protein [Pseudomonadota bacterium]